MLHRGLEVAFLRRRLAEQHVELGPVGVLGEQPVEDRLRLDAPAAPDQGQAVGVLERTVGRAGRIGGQERRRAIVDLGVEPRQREHPPQRGIVGLPLQRRRQGRGRLFELAGVEPGDAQRVLNPREARIHPGGLLEVTRGPGEAPGLRRHDAEVEGGPGQGRSRRSHELLANLRREAGDRRLAEDGQPDDPGRRFLAVAVQVVRHAIARRLGQGHREALGGLEMRQSPAPRRPCGAAPERAGSGGSPSGWR